MTPTKLRITLEGGPAAPGYSFPVPIHAMQDLPPYVCSGLGEPYEHFTQRGATAVYDHVGRCRDVPHPGGYPHEH